MGVVAFPRPMLLLFLPPARLPPNMRLKLSAPVAKKVGMDAEIRCRRIPFVNIPAWRRSLSAIR